MSQSFFKSLFGRKGDDAATPLEQASEIPADDGADQRSGGDKEDTPQDSTPPAEAPETPSADDNQTPDEWTGTSPADPIDPAGTTRDDVPDQNATPQQGNAAPTAQEYPAPATQDEAAPVEKKQGWLTRLRSGLGKTSTKLSEGVTSIFTKRRLDDDTLEELEDLLISADLGAGVAGQVTARLAKDKYDKEISDREVREALADIVSEIMTQAEHPLVIDAAHRPHIILMTGVNGAGKTTTIGKLAARFKADGKSVMMAAGDTFRAAAIEQLAAWGERTGSPVVRSAIGADAAGLAFDAVKKAQAENIDVLLIDTAGRLQNRRELMDELAKVVRVIRKIVPDAPHDTLLVLDATVGQNALSQTAAFKEIAEISGLVMTKLDGTARGGVLVALTEKFGLPVHYIGVGEGVDDLQPFRAEPYTRALAGLAD